MNIMIVDDNKHFLKAFRFTLEENFGERIEEIFEARDGIECLEIMRVENIDLIFMDLDMPEMDGVEATKKITDLYRGVIVIGVSFHSELQEIQKMIQAGARNYIIKEEITREILEDCLKIT